MGAACFSLLQAERRQWGIGGAVGPDLGLGERVPDDEEFHDPGTYGPTPFRLLVGLRCRELPTSNPCCPLSLLGLLRSIRTTEAEFSHRPEPEFVS